MYAGMQYFNMKVSLQYDTMQPRGGDVYKITLPIGPIILNKMNKQKMYVNTKGKKNIRRRLKKIIINFGYQCEIASDGYEALKMTEKNGYDLIFMDIMMEGWCNFIIPMVKNQTAKKEDG